MDPEQELALYMRSKGVQHAAMKDMLDQFAHNLAQAIRAQHKELCEPLGDDLCTCASAAALIDPYPEGER